MAANSNDLKLTLRFNAENKEFLGQVRSSSNAITDLGSKTNRTGTELTSLASNSNTAGAGLSSLKGQVLGVVGGFSALAAAISAKDRLGEYQNMRTQITSLVGSQEAWAETELYLNGVAEAHNKTIDVLGESYARLLSLENGGLITHQQTVDIFEGMSNAASANGATNAQLGQVMYGLQQAMASGTVRAEEFNQVTEAMPDLLIKIAAASGTTVGGLRNMVNSGQMTSNLFGETLVKALAQYDGAAAKTANNITAQEAAFDRAYLKMVKAYETPISTVFGDSISGVTSVMEVFADNAEGISDLVGVALVAAMARGSASVLQYTSAKVNKVMAEREDLQATVASTEAEMVATQAEIRRLEIMQVSNNQMFRAIGGEKLLAASRTQVAAQTKILTAAQVQLNVAARAGAATMALLGGPLGVAMLAAGALAYFATQSDETKKASSRLSEETKKLVDDFKGLTEEGKKRAFQNISDSATDARRQLLQVRVAMSEVTQEMVNAEKSGDTGLAVKKRQELQKLNDQATLFSNAVTEANSQFQALLDNQNQGNWTQPPTDEPDSEAAKKSAERMLENLTRQAALYGKTSEAAKVRYEIEHGSLKGINEDLQKQLLLQAELIDKKRAADEKPKTEKIDTYVTSSEELQRRYREQLAIQADYENKAKIQEDFAYDDRQADLQSKFDEAYAQAKGNGLLQLALEDQLARDKETLRREHELNLTQIAKEAEDDRQAYQQQVAMNTLTFTQQQLSITTDFLKSSGKEQSGIYRALFAVQKAAAIPSMVVATEEAAAKALTLGPIAGPIVSGAVKALGYASIGIAAGTAIAGVAHDGINRVPKSNEGTWLLKADEMVLNPTQADSFRWMVDMMSQMKAMQSAAATSAAGAVASGGMPVSINVTGVDKSQVTSAAQVKDGQLQIDMVINQAVEASMAAMYEDADNGGPVSRRIRQG